MPLPQINGFFIAGLKPCVSALIFLECGAIGEPLSSNSLGAGNISAQENRVLAQRP
jgi:hypothetical protein